MKLTIFGATGGTGEQVVRQACTGGHDVTAVVRDPTRLAFEAPSLQVLAADVMDPDAIAPALEGRDAVISAIGSREARSPTTVCTDSARSIIEAMRQNSVRRLVVVSNSGMHIDSQDGAFVRAVIKPVLGRVLRHAYADMRHMEELVQATDLDWTIVRPPRLINAPATGNYRTAINQNVPRASVITRADLAAHILHTLTDPTTVRATTSVAR
ncbi:SDR family oxidoreductase [Actinoplanes sp. TRM 88003]|uniref:SDR family oxidoreductase n=1 Tax=Paractinoplanes aksuensis TaxID=2939490 RepID=A0ABT1DU13_9ACTN|nr:SDR family oxidoreductase [Actinoplanes aksuensis]MCO8274305.1 SDR family oxidoreductase [Actinoplanes aksuensis]